MIWIADFKRAVDEASDVLAEHIVRVLDGLVLEPIRAVDDALDSPDREDDFESKEEAP